MATLLLQKKNTKKNEEEAAKELTANVQVLEAISQLIESDGSQTEKKKIRQDLEPEKLDENFYSDNVIVEGLDIQPIETFDDPKIPEKFKPIFANFESPTPIQKYTWPALYLGRDVISIAKTGSGKTLAFGVPFVSRIKSIPQYPTMLVMAPTRELALQIHEVLDVLAKNVNLKAVVVYGGTDRKQQQSKLFGADILIATPGRLLDFLLTKAVSLEKVQYLVLDEADQMLDLGFEREMKQITEYLTAPKRQTAMFSATWPTSVQELATMYLDCPVMIRVGDVSTIPTANKAITQHVEKTISPMNKMQRLESILYSFSDNDKVLIFCNRKKAVSRVSKMLNQQKLHNEPLSSNSSQHFREKALAKFKTGQIKILVATDVASRGLDIPDVEAVINYDFPQTIEAYVHRIGRTGRAGRTGNSYTFVDPKSDSPKLMNQLVQVLESAGQEVPSWLLNTEFTGQGNGVRNPHKEHQLQRYYSLGGRAGVRRDGKPDFGWDLKNIRPPQPAIDPTIQALAEKLKNVDQKKLDALVDFLTNK